MNTTTNTETLGRIVPELHEAVRALIETGYEVYVYTGGSRLRESWIIIAWDGVATVEHDRLDGFKVLFPIKPSRQDGSGLLVADPETGTEPTDAAGIVRAATRATGDTYGNFATPGRELPNHGWEHFAWMRDRVARVVVK